MVYTRDPEPEAPPKPKTYDVRGNTITDKDFEEIKPILYAEVSMRRPERQAFEARHIVNTALNRMSNQKGKTLEDIMKAPYQYQGYAPAGTTRNGKTTKSQYQLVLEGDKSIDQRRMQAIEDVFNEMRTGKFEDTTGGVEYYVHASDGTLWLGKTPKEAKQRALSHEALVNAPQSRFGTTTGLPVY